MRLLISYSHIDTFFAKKLKVALEEYNFQTFLDEHNIEIGDDIVSRIKNEIYIADFVLVLITPNSVKSDWVQWEIGYTLDREINEQRKKLLPILMHGNLLPAQIANRAYADFRTADLMETSYSKLIKLLLRAIPKFESLLSKDKKIDMGKINRDFFTAQEKWVLKSPMIGEFHIVHGLNRPPLVQVGDIVTPGKVVCIIDAMKLYNEIETEKGGKILEILAEDGQPVEYDQPLIIIELDGKQT